MTQETNKKKFIQFGKFLKKSSEYFRMCTFFQANGLEILE